MSKHIKTFWCLLEPCRGLRYRALTADACAGGHETFADSGAFRTHLAETHDFDVDRCLNLKQRQTNHFDGPTHFWWQALILDGEEPVGYLDEQFEREPEDAACWAAARGDEDADP